MHSSRPAVARRSRSTGLGVGRCRSALRQQCTSQSRGNGAYPCGEIFQRLDVDENPRHGQPLSAAHRTIVRRSRRRRRRAAATGGELCDGVQRTADDDATACAARGRAPSAGRRFSGAPSAMTRYSSGRLKAVAFESSAAEAPSFVLAVLGGRVRDPALSADARRRRPRSRGHRHRRHRHRRPRSPPAAAVPTRGPLASPAPQVCDVHPRRSPDTAARAAPTISGNF